MGINRVIAKIKNIKKIKSKRDFLKALGWGDNDLPKKRPKNRKF